MMIKLETPSTSGRGLSENGRDVQVICHTNIQSFFVKLSSGDHDKDVNFLSTQAWIRSLNYSIIDDWRAWTVDNQVAGYTRSYSNQMTFATVKGAGHTAPEYKPRECLAMLTRWMSYQPL